MKRRRTARTSMLLAGLFASASGPLKAQLVSDLYGWIRDSSSGQPVVEAEVRLLSSGRSTLSNGSGFFAFSGVPSGSDSVTVSLIGYQARTVEVLLLPGQSVRLEVGLSQEAIELEPIEVSVRPNLRARRIEEFNRRSELYSGFFLQEADLDLRGTTPLGLLLGNLPGTTVTGGRSLNDPFVILFRAGRCQPTIWVDGRRYRDIQDALGSIRANQIEALEIYRGGEAPAEFSATGRCITLVVWTK